MFKIYDGRDWLYQWDLNRKLRVSDPSVTQVHFSNRKRDTALVLEVYEHEGIRVADIPNILLQDCCPLVAYAYLDEHTKKSFAFDVKRRPKPEEYKYTETEVLTFYTMMERAEKAADAAENCVARAEAAANGVDDKLAGLAWFPKEEAVLNTVLPETKLSNNILATTLPGFELTVGETYLVTYGGNEYNMICKAYAAGDITVPYLGNLHLLDRAAEDTGEPFGMGATPEGGTISEKAKTEQNTIMVQTEELVLNKLPNEYLDLDWMPTKEREVLLAETIVERSYTQLDFLLEGLNSVVVVYDGTEYILPVKVVTAEEIGEAGDENYYVVWNELVFLTQNALTDFSYITCYDGKTHTISILGNEKYNKLPVEFLPDGVPYLAESENAEILPENPLIGDDNDSSEYYFMEVVTAPIVGGDTYIVSYNGVEYPCAAVEMTQEGMTGYIFGNYAAMTGAGDTGEPFIAIVLPAEYAASLGVGGMVVAIDGSTPVTIAISGSSREARKLPNELLDLEWIPTKHNAGMPLTPEVTVSGTGYVKDIGSRDFLPYDSVIVVFDGVEYECYPQFSDDGNIKDAFMTISNVPDASLIPGENPDQKFLIMGVLGQLSLIPSDGGTHTYLIKTAEYSYNKLDNGYLNLDWLPVRGTKEIFRPTVFKHNKATYGGTIFDLKSIIVIYEGVRYSCPVRFETAEEAAEAADVCSASNHLFALWSLRGGSSVYAYFADGKDHFLSILDGESYNKLPEGYLPESVEGVIIRSSTEGSSKKFKLTVDDSGTITATEVT